VSCSTRSLPEESSVRKMPPCLWSKYCHALTIATKITSSIEILNQKISCSSRTRSSIKSKLLILVLPSSSTRTRSSMKSLEPHITLPQKSWLKTTELSVIFGLVELLHISLYQVFLHLMARLIKILWRRSRLENSVSAIQSGQASQIQERTSLHSCWPRSRRRDHQHSKLSNTLGFSRPMSSKRNLSPVKWLWAL